MKSPVKPAEPPKKKRARTTTAAHDEKRHDIIAACASLFDRVGYHGTSMQMLADEVGLGKPTLYHYFASKGDILYEMHQLHIDAMIGGLQGDPQQGEAQPAELLERACTSTLREIALHPGYVRAFMDHYAELEDKQRAEMRERRREYFTRITNIIRDGMSKGHFREMDPELATLTFVGMCNWAYKWYPRMANEVPPEKMAKSMCQLLLDGFNKR
ncbi:TetR/AcrR family transcriptional regulator [Aromatoleum toluclasticum]|uniref:TetR/AcrR family transcriptional regulator n=1 Tax=Aromatoleum toluclasticum TaxID=92003 RepID=UPI000375E145|nr:TetR/AcrR family transcriptional regulator [Aromatoleum toluclasticum]MCC4114787.1 TetR/AcrR family transcriptional regulator [Aromatoleum toluclasticum]